ncbi:MAG: APC family permease [Solirubrobacterales bacterium]|nr:APC family permease [Solirubrobacterales bacterium]
MATAEVEEQHLVQSLTWWDGFVVALANPAFLIAALGASIGALGTLGAVVLWTFSVLVGALQNNIYGELATMFKDKAGGITLFAHEAWRKYATFVGPLATFGYWFAWSSVLAVTGIVVGTLVQAQFFESTTWTASGGGFDLSLPILIGMAAMILVAGMNMVGLRQSVAFTYLTGAMLCLPLAVLMFLPYVSGDFSSGNLDWNIGEGGGLPLVLVWLYFMGWSSYGFEAVASLAPEYRDPEKDTPRALRASAAFSVAVYALLPLGLGGTLSTEAVTADETFVAFYSTAFEAIVGSGLANVMIICLVAGLLLSLNTAVLDGSRALYGIARDGMTVRQLGVLNRAQVPGRAIVVALVMNLFLISFFASAVEIFAAGNLGYMLAHVFALSGFLLLRRDRPNWPRPLRLSSAWVVIAGVLAVWNLVLVIFGGFVFAEEYGYGFDKTLIGVGVLALSLVLWVFRRVGQDRKPLQLRDPVPDVPENAEKVGAPVGVA